MRMRGHIIIMKISWIGSSSFRVLQEFDFGHEKAASRGGKAG